MLEAILERIRRLLTHNWQNRLVVVFTGTFLLAYVQWFSMYWLPETKQIVLGALLITCILECISNISFITRKCVQILAVVAWTGWHVSYWPVYVAREVDSVLSVFQWIVFVSYANVEMFLPYIWFALGTCLIYSVLLVVLRSKTYIIVVIMSSIVLFAVIDSFTQWQLYQEVALIIISGLFLLVMQHYEKLKVEKPFVWHYLLHYPSLGIVPVALLICIMVGVGVMAPEVRPMVTDPYTAWQTWQGEEVVILGDGDGVFTSEGDSSSGYRRDDGQLGGGFEFDSTPVMSVHTRQRSYWRGETREYYSGSGWENTDEAESWQQMNAGESLPVAADLNTDLLETVEVEQHITLVTEDSFPVLFAAYQPESVQDIQFANETDTNEENDGNEANNDMNEENDGNEANNDMGNEPTLSGHFYWSAQNAELHWDENDSYPVQYTITSHLPVWDEDGLRDVPFTHSNDDAWQPYVQVPDTLPERVFDLASDIIGDAHNMYDQVRSVEQYLVETYSYETQPDSSQAQSADFVDQFLFEVQEGYCDYFSTAMVVLLRTQGIPARWVKGYTSGQMEEEEYVYQYANMDQSNIPMTYTVRNANAHSWVEVYFDGYGWLPFEPTPGFSLPQAEAENDGGADFVQGEQGHTEENEDNQAFVSVTTIAMIMGSGSFLLLIWMLRDPLTSITRRLLQRQTKKATAQELEDRVQIECTRLLRYLSRKGYVRFDHETLRESMERWGRDNVWIRKELKSLTLLMERMQYSPERLNIDDYDQTQRLVKRLREEV